MIVITVLDDSGAVAAVVGFSPAAITVFGAGGGATTPVGCISPARAAPESTHARAIAKAKRVILSVSPLRMPVHWQENSIV